MAVDELTVGAVVPALGELGQLEIGCHVPVDPNRVANSSLAERGVLRARVIEVDEPETRRRNRPFGMMWVTRRRSSLAA
jgi:hypothetical protein